MADKPLSPLRRKDIETGRKLEREAIVTWLRSGQFEDLDGHDIAEEIEAGAHTNYHPPSTRRQP
jgi:hypothetical protein